MCVTKVRHFMKRYVPMFVLAGVSGFAFEIYFGQENLRQNEELELCKIIEYAMTNIIFL